MAVMEARSARQEILKICGFLLKVLSKQVASAVSVDALRGRLILCASRDAEISSFLFKDFGGGNFDVGQPLFQEEILSFREASEVGQDN